MLNCSFRSSAVAIWTPNEEPAHLRQDKVRCGSKRQGSAVPYRVCQRGFQHLDRVCRKALNNSQVLVTAVLQ